MPTQTATSSWSPALMELPMVPGAQALIYLPNPLVSKLYIRG
jgi:hypothetical protein